MADVAVREIAAGLRFPEGPIALDDGTVVLVEIARGTLSRVTVATGAIEVVADCGGGPNGAALGPDAKVYVANNGGYFTWADGDGPTVPGPRPEAHVGGSIQRVDLETGVVETLYDACDGHRLVAPNDLVFDAHGGFWFTDHGVQSGDPLGRPGLLYARADGSSIVGAAYGTNQANGVGLSPVGDRVYMAETHHAKLWEWAVPAPGIIAGLSGDPTVRSGGRLLADPGPGHLYDSLAVDGDGWICVATIGPGGITAVAPDGATTELLDVPDDFLVTNICFSARTVDGAVDEQRRTAFVTASSSGRLVALSWPRTGLALAYASPSSPALTGRCGGRATVPAHETKGHP